MYRGHEYKGLFITFEGIDFCGKSTQIDLLDDYMNKNHIRHIVRREPGGTDIGEQNRNILLSNNNTKMFAETEAYQFAASRSQLVMAHEPVVKK